MNEKFQCSIQLFGAFRDCEESGQITIELTNGKAVSQIKADILSQLMRSENSTIDLESLVSSSVLATANEILGENDVLNLSSMGGTFELAILPPVCGG